MHETINCRGRLLDLRTPKVMGILNVTPDSFYDGGIHNHEISLEQHIEELISKGADIIDVGGMSSRPGAVVIKWEEEWSRVSKALKILESRHPDVPISLDTIHSEVLLRGMDYGVSLVNDISGGENSPEMVDMAAKHGLPYIVMHMQGSPSTMQQEPKYDAVVLDIIKYLNAQVKTLHEKGVKDVIVDPGFGFGKTIEHNYQLLQNLHTLKLTQCPILVGLSRKSMIYKALDIDPQSALNGTTALHMKALSEGASILRVHDVREAVECIQLHTLLNKS